MRLPSYVLRYPRRLKFLVFFFLLNSIFCHVVDLHRCYIQLFFLVFLSFTSFCHDAYNIDNKLSCLLISVTNIESTFVVTKYKTKPFRRKTTFVLNVPIYHCFFHFRNETISLLTRRQFRWKIEAKSWTVVQFGNRNIDEILVTKTNSQKRNFGLTKWRKHHVLISMM